MSTPSPPNIGDSSTSTSSTVIMAATLNWLNIITVNRLQAHLVQSSLNLVCFPSFVRPTYLCQNSNGSEMLISGTILCDCNSWSHLPKPLFHRSLSHICICVARCLAGSLRRRPAVVPFFPACNISLVDCGTGPCLDQQHWTVLWRATRWTIHDSTSRAKMNSCRCSAFSRWFNNEERTIYGEQYTERPI